jgi:ArsR family transcriptional regulator
MALLSSITESQARILKALAHPTRLQILEILKDGEKCVCELLPALGLEQSNVSQHLAILREHGLIDHRKEGLRVIYWIKDERVFEIIDIISKILVDRLKETEATLKLLKGVK